MRLLYASHRFFQKNHANLWTFFESGDIFQKKNFFVDKGDILQ